MARTIDRAVLDILAQKSMSREAMVAAGYRNMCKSCELHRVGYNVVYWVRPGQPESELLEYVPRVTYRTRSDYPRVTVRCYEEQAALHRALGLAVVGRGEHWRKRRDESPGLFDSQNI